MGRDSGFLAALAAFACIGLFAGSEARAVESAPVRCEQVLSDPSLWTDEFRANDTIQLIVHSRFVRADYNQAANDAASGFGVPLGRTVFGGAFDANRFLLRKEYLAKALYPYAVPAKREIDAALASGAPGVVAAWKACARAQGGTTIRFDPQSPRDAVAYIEYFGPAGDQATVLDDASLPDGVTAVTGSACLKAGHVLKAGQPCVMVVALPEATMPLLLALNASDGLTMGYLPSRVVLGTETRPFPFTPGCNLSAQSVEAERTRCKDRLWRAVVAKGAVARHAVAIPGDLPGELIGQGWEFKNETAAIAIDVLDRFSPSNTSRCDTQFLDAKFVTFDYGYTLRSAQEHHQDAYITCAARPQIDMVRPVWIPLT